MTKRIVGVLIVLSMLVSGCAFLATPQGGLVATIIARHLGKWLGENNQPVAKEVVNIAEDIISFIGYGSGDGIKDPNIQIMLGDMVRTFVDKVDTSVKDKALRADFRDISRILIDAIEVEEISLTIKETDVALILRTMEAFKEGVGLAEPRRLIKFRNRR